MCSAAAMAIASVENARLYEQLAMQRRRMEEDLQAARELPKVRYYRRSRLKVWSGRRTAPGAGNGGDIYDF